MDIIKTKTIGKYRIDIEPYIDPESPREDDNLGTMICFHSRYNLGDKHNYDHRDYNGWEEMKYAIIKKDDVAIILPLYLYDHSGITMNTTGFSCRWDSGQVGFIFISKEKIREEYGVKKITKKLIEKIKTYLINEVNTYDQYLRGDVYGFRITELDENGEDVKEVDSCWGYYGIDFSMEEAESVANHMIKNDKQGQLELDLK
jgi:hypothetical protein